MEEMVETLGTLMIIYEVLSAVGGVIQIALVILRRTNNVLLILAMILDAISLSGMSTGLILKGEPLNAGLSLGAILLDVAFIMYIVYREEHPKEKSSEESPKDSNVS